GGHRLERVGHKDYPRLERDLIAAEAERIASSVEVLVVVEHPSCLFLEFGGRDDRMTDEDVAAHRGGLVRSQARGLSENPVRDADLADVVQQPRQPKALDPGIVEVEGERDPRAEL